MDVFEYQLENRLPALAAKLKKEGFIVPYYAIEWFTTCFTLYVPLTLTKAIFELWLAGLDNIFVRVGMYITIMCLCMDVKVYQYIEKGELYCSTYYAL